MTGKGKPVMADAPEVIEPDNPAEPAVDEPGSPEASAANAEKAPAPPTTRAAQGDGPVVADVTYGVLIKPLGDLAEGQIVTGSSAEIGELGDAGLCVLATPDQVERAAPFIHAIPEH
jgi:hypothetical protein